jgi:phosphate transport system substrate-binding protein
VANGSATGLTDLVNGDAEVAMVSGPVSDIRQSIDREKPGALGDNQFTEYRVGTTTASFIVHPSNPVQSLSEDQMRDVLTGKITNWKTLGGLDQPIVLLVTKPGDGARSLVEIQFLRGQELTPAARKIAALPQVVQIISQLPNGIGLSDGSVTKVQVVTVSGVKIEQALNLVTIGPPTEPVRKLIEMASQMATGQ